MCFNLNKTKFINLHTVIQRYLKKRGLMAVQKIVELEKGVKLVYQKQGSFNGYSFAIGFKGGAQLDGQYKGLSHLLEHLLFRTPNPRSTSVLLDNILKYTINQNAYTTQDCICVHFSCTYGNVEKALENCMSNIIGRTRFTQAQIDREIEIVKHEIKMYEDRLAFDLPSALECLLSAMQIAPADMSTFDILGSAKSLHKITPEILKTYVKRYFNSENLIISVTSNKPIEKVIELCNTYILPKVKPATSKRYIICPPPAPIFHQKNLLVAMPNDISESVSICLMLRERTGKADDINLEYAYDIVEEYLMNHMGGMLWDILRQKNQLVYEYSLSNLDFDTVKFKAINLTTTAPKMRKAISEVCKLIYSIAQNGIPKEKFDAVKKMLTDVENANLNKFKPCSANSNFQEFLHGQEYVDYKKVNSYLQNMTYEDFIEHITGIYAQGNASLAVEGKFDTRKCYTLIEIEKMLGNYSHVESASEMNVPRVEETPLSSTMTLDLITLMQMMGQSAESEDTEQPKQPEPVNMDGEKIK